MSAHTTLFAGAGRAPPPKPAIQNTNHGRHQKPVYSAFSWLNTSDSTFTLADATGSVLGYHAVRVLGYGRQRHHESRTAGAPAGAITRLRDHRLGPVQSKVMEAVAGNTFVAGQTRCCPCVTKVSSAAVNTTSGAAFVSVTPAAGWAA